MWLITLILFGVIFLLAGMNSDGALIMVWVLIIYCTVVILTHYYHKDCELAVQNEKVLKAMLVEKGSDKEHIESLWKADRIIATKDKPESGGEPPEPKEPRDILEELADDMKETKKQVKKIGDQDHHNFLFG